MANQHTSRRRDATYLLHLTAGEMTAVRARAVAQGVTLAELIRTSLGLTEAPVLGRKPRPRVLPTHAFIRPGSELASNDERVRDCKVCGNPEGAPYHEG